jgi:type IV secretory pathway VirB3-like protein
MGNLGPLETRKRMMFGGAMLVVGLILTAVLFFLDLQGIWLLLLFVPFWLAALGLLQGREST